MQQKLVFVVLVLFRARRTFCDDDADDDDDVHRSEPYYMRHQPARSRRRRRSVVRLFTIFGFLKLLFVMGSGNVLLPFFFLQALVLPPTAALSFYDVLHRTLPHNMLPEAAISGRVSPPGRMALTAATAETGGGGEEEVGDSEGRVDFGTKAWPYVYYSRRDRKGTVDWGTMAWPYIYYTSREGKAPKDKDGKSGGDDGAAAAATPITFPGGRKCGSQFGV